MKTIQTTLLIIRQNGKLLLAKKKRGFGEGLINGVGGKLMEGETPDDAMFRETFEEIGIRPLDAKKFAIISYDEVMKGERVLVVMHTYIATKFENEPVESDEMQPLWVDENNLPYSQMFGDDKYWYPLMFEGKKFKANFVFDDNFNILSFDINEVESID